jgi:RAQPRD family integrative conjugative element protein
MKEMKKMKKVFLMIILAGLFIAPSSFADEAQEKMYLNQLLNQLDAMQPLIIAAQKSEPKNARIQFHYTRFRDVQGKPHNGLLEDIQAIRAGVAQKLNSVTVEPRAVSPIKGDYDDRG